LDHLDIQRAHIVGYSMGGVIVVKLLASHPERFLTATVGGSAGRRNWTTNDDRAAETAAAEIEKGSLRPMLLPGRAIARRSPRTAWSGSGSPCEDDHRREQRSSDERTNRVLEVVKYADNHHRTSGLRTRGLCRETSMGSFSARLLATDSRHAAPGRHSHRSL
jgi:pimeloyl-ACP methyl ester carboxylesterase